MKIQLGFALLALLALTAFAPAPFPRTQRRSSPTEISLETFQGRWLAKSIVVSRANGQHTPDPYTFTHVRIRNDQWTFMTRDAENNKYRIAIDSTAKPARLTFYPEAKGIGGLSGVALIRRQGDRVEVLYTWGGEERRPKTFDPPPDGPWLLTLERDK